MKTYQALARRLSQRGAEPLFGLMGDANMQYIASFIDEHGGRYIGSTHEAGAVGMADGFARASGSVGVATVTHGPGTTNTITALIEAVRSGTALVLLTSSTPSSSPHHLQKIDLQRLIEPTGAAFRRAARAQDVPDELERALGQARAESRPVALDVPVEFLDEEIEDTGAAPQQAPPAAPADLDPDLLDSALGMIASARRPLVLAGRGAVESDAHEAITAFADLIGAAVATTVPARGFFAGHDLDLGVCGTLAHPVGLTAILDSDCVVVFGASLNDYTTDSGALLKGKPVVHVDRFDHHLNRYYEPNVALCGDAATVATRMTELLRAEDVTFASSRAGLAEELRKRVPSDEFVEARGSDAVDMRAAMLRLSPRLPANRAVVTDAGRFLRSVWRYIDVSHPRYTAGTVSFGSIGLGIGCATGVSVAVPDLVTVVFVGDGGGMMSLTEFNTAVRYRLPLVAVVINDGSYGAEYSKLQGFNADPRHSLMEWPEFADLGVALGGNAVTVRSLQAIDELDESLWAPENLPLLIDVKVDPAVDYYA
ncbi:Acetolactate synthase large subunit [Geodermatophilus amargosae]|uniref:Acetolactate synthase large subunit n=1 Tax=Geodermatophilus amargosae TaxID=1296565 RepID=A0A1I7D1Z0_9ACTN|nr:thiamine pyrophosphate-binding protein [Geodermatophilus amargosae]SFU05673.1 Acetolactate synthase large subunit [Geodermatophilus amargosae]